MMPSFQLNESYSALGLSVDGSQGSQQSQAGQRRERQRWEEGIIGSRVRAVLGEAVSGRRGRGSKVPASWWVQKTFYYATSWAK